MHTSAKVSLIRFTRCRNVRPSLVLLRSVSKLESLDQSFEYGWATEIFILILLHFQPHSSSRSEQSVSRFPRPSKYRQIRLPGLASLLCCAE